MSKPRKIGYARVSTIQQNLERQLGALTAERCHVIYQEKASGKAIAGRPQLEKALSALGTGDVLIVAEWDRATRSMVDGITIMQRVAARGAFIKVLDKPHLDLTTKVGQGLLVFLSALADDERQRINNRSNEGRKLAQARGVKFGRKPKLNKTQRTRALMLKRKGMPVAKIAEEMNCHHSTIVRLR